MTSEISFQQLPAPYSFIPLEKRPDCVGLRLLKSPLFWSALFCVVTITLATLLATRTLAVSTLSISSTTATGIVAILIIFYHSKQLKYETTFLSQFIFKNAWWSDLQEGLVLGALPVKEHAEQLKKEGITHFLSMVEEFEFEPTFFAEPLKHQPNPRWLHLPTTDFRGIQPAVIQEGIKWIDKQIKGGGKVYVHCKAGIGRSGIIAICYLMKYRKMTKDAAIAFVQSKRPQVNLNPSQLRSLDNFLN